MQIVDPLNNPATVELSTLAAGACFTKYDSDAGVQLHYLILATGGSYSVLKFETNVVSSMPAATQVVPRTASVTFG